MIDSLRHSRRGGAWAALLCAVVACLAVVVAPAAAETGGGKLPVWVPGSSYPTIETASDPETYSWRVELEAGQTLVAVSDERAVIRRGSEDEGDIVAPTAHDADGELVPTSIAVSEGDVLTLTVRHHEAEYAYPITLERPWLIISQESTEPVQIPVAEDTGTPNPYVSNYVYPPFEPNFTPKPACEVPKLAGLGRHAAAAKLRAEHCKLGKVRLARGATAAKGKVVKQSHAAGAGLAPGAPVAIKLG